MHIRPECHWSEWDHGRQPTGYLAGSKPEISVEVGEDSDVALTLDPINDEHTFGISRFLTSGEARDLAAMLNHAADMADRRMGNGLR